MASCSPREVEAATRVMTWIQEPVGGVDLFDAGFEMVRHALLQAWVETNERDRTRAAPFLDLLTSLKLMSKVPVLTATPLGGHSSLRHALEERPQDVRLLQDRAMWMAALTPDWGAAQFSVRFILSRVDYPIQDRALP